MAQAPRKNAATFAWFVLVYTVLVILFGAWVRITGSGAGCGQHWPTCHGEVVHRPESMETVIELTHRVTSAFDGLFVIALLVVMAVSLPRRHLARRGAWLSLLFVITEGLVGALLVKAELVADNASVSRAIVMSIHLVNTSLLTGAMALTAWAAYDPELRLERRPGVGWRIGLAAALLLVVMMSGAVTALGDTLYPVAAEASKVDVMRAAQHPTAHFLQRVRVFHPALAVGAALALYYLALGLKQVTDSVEVTRHAHLTIALVGLQVVLGGANIWLSAPGWMQIVHLGLATLLWVELCLLAFSSLRARSPVVAEP